MYTHSILFNLIALLMRLGTQIMKLTINNIFRPSVAASRLYPKTQLHILINIQMRPSHSASSRIECRDGQLM